MHDEVIKTVHEDRNEHQIIREMRDELINTTK